RLLTPSMSSSYSFFFFTDTATTEIYTLSLHDALPIYAALRFGLRNALHAMPAGLELEPGVGALADDLRDHFLVAAQLGGALRDRSEEHTSELQSRRDLVCRLLLEKKK